MQRSRSIAISGESSSGFSKWRLGSTKRERPPPQPKEMSCSGHSPPLSQTGQSSGWVISRNSTTACWAVLTRLVWVWTTIPSLTGVEHAVCSFGMPSISTRHMRQAPTAAPRLGSQQKTGISTSPCLAPSTSMTFSGAVTSRPSMEKVTIRCSGRGIRYGSSREGPLDERLRRRLIGREDVAAGPRLLDVGLELVAELLDHRADRHRHRVAEDAQAVADDLLLDRGHDVEVHRGRLARLDALEHLVRPVRPLAARRALAAGLVAVELRGLQRDVDDRVRVVDHDDRAGPEHRAGLGHRVEVVGKVEVVGLQHRGARAAREPELDLAALGRAAREAVDDVARLHPELDLEVAGVRDVARDRHELRAGRALDAELRVLLAAHLDDGRHRRERLDVVDQRGPLVQALVGGERRLEARVAALALERVEQRGLLAADVRAGATVDPELERVVGAEDAVAQVALGLRLLDRLLEARGLQVVLTADVDERARGADDVRRDDHALDEHVRRLLHELAVLERAGLGLVGVADEVLVHRALGQEGRLLAHREAGAAAAADPRAVELGEHVLAAHPERLAQRPVAAAALVDVEGVEARLVDVLEQEEVGHWRFAFGSTLLRRLSCLGASTSSPSRICWTTVGTSSISTGPT